MSTTPSVAIIGSGPSGCYLAQGLRKHWPEADITIFDQLASPFGLVRYGVAADHQSTKAVTRQFDRLFERDNVRFAGNIRVGEDVTLEQLQQAYSVVAFATGLTQDRKLGIEGESLPGVYGAGVITRRLNSHPVVEEGPTTFGDRVVVIGNGNVAMDIVRFLIKRPADYEGSDINDALVDSYNAARAKRIDVVGRSVVADAKCDALMVKELGKVEGVRFSTAADCTVPEGADRATSGRIEAVRELNELEPAGNVDTEVVFHFGYAPEKITGETTVTGVDFTPTTTVGEALHIEADSVIAAIGFELQADASQMFGEEAPQLIATPETGRFGQGLYRTGWFKRGPRGTIPENRADAKEVTDEIIADVEGGVITTLPSQTGFAALPESVREKAVSFVDWQRLDAHEQATANAGRIRTKISDHAQMVAIAKNN